MHLNFRAVVAIIGVFVAPSISAAEPLTTLRGEVRDASTGDRLPARLYIRSNSGQWFFAKSAAEEGSAIEYNKQRSATSLERHTTLSAHPFQAKLPPGKYTLTVERGKEYLPATASVAVGGEWVTHNVKLKRWIDMAARGWYSGDTHVHRLVAELPNVMLAEDLNVALPLTHWVTTAYTPPSRGNKNTDTDAPAKLIRVDRTHVIYPMNTEYEIFSVGKNRHTLGAVFVLNHKKPFEIGTPPVRPIAEEARRQGAILDLDKHSWPWSLMLVPVMNVDLFELSNNHIWRTKFHFRRWTQGTKPKYVQLETNEEGWTERGWTEFGFQTYYTLLNCGFRMRPTAGTASGVHPVPLGFGRVYVELPDGFDYNAWIHGLNAGRSFVSTGPMLFVKYNGQPPGHIFQNVAGKNPSCRVTGTAESARPLDRIEVIVNGEIRRTIKPANDRTKNGGYVSPIDEQVALDGSSWIVVRCFQKHPSGRQRFAHGSPVHFEVTGKPLRPRRAEVEYLISRMQQEIDRNKDVLKPAEVDEYRAALDIYRRIAKSAR